MTCDSNSDIIMFRNWYHYGDIFSKELVITKCNKIDSWEKKMQ